MEKFNFKDKGANNILSIHYHFKAYLIYEQLCKIMNISDSDSLNSICLLFYSFIQSNNISLEYDDLLELLTFQPNLLSEFSEWLKKSQEFLIKNDDDKKDDIKKKK